MKKKSNSAIANARIKFWSVNKELSKGCKHSQTITTSWINRDKWSWKMLRKIDQQLWRVYRLSLMIERRDSNLNCKKL